MMPSHQQDFFKEILNLGMGRAAAVLEKLTHSPVRLAVPNVTVSDCETLSHELVEYGKDDLISVSMTFKGIVSGQVVFVLSPYSSLILTELVMRTAQIDDLRDGQADVVTEIGNIVLNNVIGSWSNLFCDQFEFGVPTYGRQPLKELVCSWINSPATSGDLQAVRGDAHFEVENFFILGSVLVLFDSASMARFSSAGIAG